MNEIIRQINELTNLVNGFAKEYPNDNRLTSQAEILQQIQKIIQDGMNEFGKDINVTTKGDAIRKSNESLVEWYASRIELFCIGEDVRVNPLNKEKCLNFLNQKVVDHENTN